MDMEDFCCCAGTSRTAASAPPSSVSRVTAERFLCMVATRPCPTDTKVKLTAGSASPGTESVSSTLLRQAEVSAFHTKRQRRFRSPYTRPSRTAVFSNHLKEAKSTGDTVATGRNMGEKILAILLTE